MIGSIYMRQQGAKRRRKGSIADRIIAHGRELERQEHNKIAACFNPKRKKKGRRK